MLLNKILMKLRRPEKGYDPVSKEHSKIFSEQRNNSNYIIIVDNIEKEFGSIKNKKILDLGAGPGFISKELLKRGANIHWHDISKNYLKIAKNILNKESASFSLGYMEEVEGEFDIIVICVCWFYCIDDKYFYEKIKKLLNKNGKLFVVFNNDRFFSEKLKEFSFIKRLRILFQYHLNNILDYKIGHPHISEKKIKRLFSDGFFRRIKFVKKDYELFFFGERE